jgi:2-haloacid dehalogenase
MNSSRCGDCWIVSQAEFTPPVRAVLFDLGGVLVDWDPRHLYRKIFADPQAMEHFLATICNSEWNEEQDAGRPFAEGVRLLVAQYPRLAAEIRAYHERWDEMLRGEIAESVVLLEGLRGRGVGLYALSNWSNETYPLARARFAFLDWFDGIVISGEEGLKKPDPRIFAVAQSRFGLVPQATLFIDDSPRNIAAASALGYRTHLFTGADALRAVFAEHGLQIR